MQDLPGTEAQLFAQVLSRDKEEMVDEAQRLREVIPSLVGKVPVTASGMAAIRQLKPWTALVRTGPQRRVP